MEIRSWRLREPVTAFHKNDNSYHFRHLCRIDSLGGIWPVHREATDEATPMRKRDRNQERRQTGDRIAAADLVLRSGGLPAGFSLAERKPVCTGPKTPEGKAVSSQNARTHGLTSRRLILPGENEEEFAELREMWLAQFPPESQAETAMVEQLARNDWFRQRAERRYLEIEDRLGDTHAADWSEEQFRQLERIVRYKTTAERSFQRSLLIVRQLRKDRQQEEREEARAEAAQKRTVYEGRGKNKKPVFTVLEQWVEVRVTDGVTTTQYVPSNAELLKQGEESENVPCMVYRRLNFPDGVPPEYGWTNLHDPERCEKRAAGEWCPLCSVKERGGCGIQRMTYETWKEVIEREALVPGQYAGPTGCGNLPRPKERGGEVPFAEMVERD